MYASHQLEKFYEDFPFYNKYPSYNNFFYPNVCHYCKKKDNGKFMTCDDCFMITYCNMDHRLRDYASHMQICEVLRKLFKSHSKFWIHLKLYLEQWIEMRKEFLNLISLQLQRDLKPYEVQMITLTKSCFICHKQMNIHTCKRCYSVNYCPKHIDRLGKHHSCSELMLCFQIDFELAFFSNNKMKFVEFPNEDKPVVNMDTFIEQYVCPKQYINGIFSKNVLAYFYSDYVSGPLTTYYGMQKIHFLYPYSCYVIHIIAANFVDREYLAAWELLLHLLPKINHLKIILIGPVLCTDYNNIEVCPERCIKHKTFNFETHRMLYYDYANSKKYTRPYLIVGFQTNLSDWEKLENTILKIKNQDCPLLLTAKSKLQANQNVNKIKKILFSSSKLVYHGENMFSSHRPYRDFESNDVSYRNKYLSIYEKL
ncbi:uncharacterized protein LOC116844143 [Odontomachus brunneus]|uniref:uncharacterized protein LOC116844143 n=1 Tax=Odontomachus brunneus TaxID=486640 RepID=UPI0013F22BE0|nr:uncharacterized protein LOC116844143 [Odontomachus brunneus]